MLYADQMLILHKLQVLLKNWLSTPYVSLANKYLMDTKYHSTYTNVNNNQRRKGVSATILAISLRYYNGHAYMIEGADK